MTIYDSCIYPQETSSPTFFSLTFWKNIVTPNNTLKVPQRLPDEQEFCIKTHLEDICRQLKECKFSNEADLNTVYQQVIMVHRSFNNAKIANTNVKSSSREITIFDRSCNQVHRYNSFMNLSILPNRFL